MFARRIAFGLLVILANSALGAEKTALDEFISAPDSSYHFEEISKVDGKGYTVSLLRLTSQQWRAPSEVDRPLWQHWLTVIRPRQISHDVGLLIVGGGSNDKAAPTLVNSGLANLAVRTGTVVSELRMVPNEPLIFSGESAARREDGIIAYSWDRYLRTGDSTWPAQLPMTKSVVRAMDVIMTYCRNPSGNNSAVEKFVVLGTSKRGWATWLSAAVDRRVIAIMPAVSDFLNLNLSIEHQYHVYGFWPAALRDYVDMGIMRWLGTTQMNALVKLVDPYAYRDRIVIPKLIVNSAGDQYFAPDSSRFYFADLAGPKYIRYVPNTDHSLKHSDAIYSAEVFYEAVVDSSPLPKYSWTFERDGSILFKSITKPTVVKLWQAVNPSARDFRYETIGAAYTSTVLKALAGDIYVGKVVPPKAGFTAFFVEATYAIANGEELKLTTDVRVLPDTVPYAQRVISGIAQE